MLYEFRSRATGTITMTSKTGAEILRIIGKDPDPTGIITVAQIPGAIAALQKAADDEPPPPADAAKPQDDDTPKEPFVSLRQRVYPLIEMLEQAKAADADVTWGV
ncbi:MAG: DUF1840 domain-containing protein [Lautropia sp.]|nr:DUF1840 domain-containing protein [Lautropia sp.]